MGWVAVICRPSNLLWAHGCFVHGGESAGCILSVLLDFSTLPAPGGVPAGFSSTSSRWVEVDGRVRATDSDTERFEAMPYYTLGAQSDVQVAALAQAYNMADMSRPSGASRTLIVRHTAGSSIVVDLLSASNQLTLRVRDRIGSSFHLRGSARFGTWNRFHGDHLFRTRVRVVDDTVQAKIWWDCEPEPAGWMVSCTTTVTAPGLIGLGCEGVAVQEFRWLGFSTDDSAPPQGPQGIVSKDAADFTGLIPLIESMCWPLYGDGTASHPNALVHPDDDVGAATPGYRAARARAIEVMVANRNGAPPPGDIPHGYSHCSRFAGTVVTNVIDPRFAADYTEWQNAFVGEYSNGWVQVGSSEHYDSSWCRPGDVWVTKDPGHVFIWVGEYGGYSDVIAEAAYNGLDMKYGLSRVGCLRRYYLTASGRDTVGRRYAVWRFIGRQPKRAFLQTANGMVQVDTFLQTEDGVVEYQL